MDAIDWLTEEAERRLRREAEEVEHLILEGHDEIVRGPILGGEGFTVIYGAPAWSDPWRRLKIEWARLGWRLGHRRRHG